MREIALHVLDIVQNSLAAGAKLICVSLEVRPEDNLLSLAIEDDGAGMDEAALAKACDPFYTSRAGKSVGLGLSLFRASAEGAGGSFSIESKRGKGTRVAASYALDHIDRPPLGDLADVLSAQIAVNPNVEFRLVLSSGKKGTRFGHAHNQMDVGGRFSCLSPNARGFEKNYAREFSQCIRR